MKTLLADEGVESIAKVPFDENDTLSSVATKMRENTERIKQGETKMDDFLIHHFSKAPRWFLRLFLSLLRWLDFHGILPKFLMDIIPLYSSVFVSHLGSIGADAPFHHLYEFGTTSIFVTIGKPYDKPYRMGSGGTGWRKAIDLRFTVDERICDGFYLVKSLKVFESFLNNPERLELSPKEYKAYKKNGMRKHDASSSIADASF